MKKVIHISARADLGGGPRHIQYLLNKILLAIDCYIACPDQKPFIDIYESILNKNKIHIIPFRSLSLNSLFTLRRFIRHNDIDIIHCHGKGAAVYGKLLKFLNRRLLLVYTPHGIHVDSYSPFQKKLYKLYEFVSSNLFNHIIYVSKSEADQARRESLFSKCNYTIIPNGVPELKQSNFYDKNSLKESLFKHPKNKLIVTLSRFDFQKNMAETFQIALSMPQYNFLWIGDGPDFKELQEKLESEGISNINMIGTKDVVAEYLLASDLYLSTARWEGMPLALLEALSAGLPIVASNVVGNKDVVSEDVGYLYELHNIDDAIHKIEMAFEKDFSNVDIKKFFFDNFSSDKMANDVLKIYSNLKNGN
ncbi:glycosyltransferase [Pedobacter zeae]|uniref:Glycosyltransferase involved in cell wall biosynthesis n=1 Tax=Pedobacter zeae TaxID=1737356 RepID=A0A7W6P8A0_9SPHI|nr:glycosyltransferase [Pedobacter zeae]MBB4109851.1 glycosyltransferase involved in cell wall biosynthesis [Pedobacter zeae]GGH14572.1 hypothetical protein GCM10007422_36030 [Pedobacter zeae]